MKDDVIIIHARLSAKWRLMSHDWLYSWL